MRLKKTVNKFNQSHDCLRRFLRLVSYGCYHRRRFADHGIRERTYDDELRQMRFFIPEQNIQVSHHAGCAYITFQGNSCNSSQNYLAHSFFLKTLLPDACLHAILLLQTVTQAGKPLSLPELLKKIEGPLLEHDPDLIAGNTDLSQLLRRRAKELSALGLLVPTGKGRNLRYGPPPKPLSGLTMEEVSRLLFALEFYRNVALLSMPGYLLAANLKETYPEIPHQPAPFQFKNNSFVRILDDDMLLTIVQAIRDGKLLQVEREGHPPMTVTPITIHTDYHYNRQYLVARKNLSPTRAEPMSLRIDKITKAVPLDGLPAPDIPAPTRQMEASLCISKIL